MPSFLIIAIVVGLTGLFAACLLIYAIGKFNHLVTLRHRISTEILQLDLALRKQSAELQALGGSPSKDFVSRLALAEEKSHRAVSGRLTGNNLALLSEASALVASCWETATTTGQDAVTKSAGNHQVATAKTWERIAALVVDYRDSLARLPGYAVALFSGFDPISPWPPLSKNRNPRGA